MLVIVTVVREEAVYSQLGGHREWVREEDVPPPTKGGREAFDTFSFATIDFYF